MDIYLDTHLDILILLREIINKIITKLDKDFQFNYDLDKIIHENGLNYIENGRLKNLELLDFIKNDKYYFDEKYNKKMDRTLNIFDGIDINLLNEENNKDEFFKKWESFQFSEIFKSQFNEFAEKLCSLIQNIKDFGLLFKFFNIYKDSKIELIDKMQRKYSELIQTYGRAMP